MTALLSTLDQMAFLLICMLAGFLLNKLHILPENSDTVISRLENYVCVPALVISSFQKYCTPKNLADNWTLILYCALFVLLGLTVAMPLGPKFAEHPGEVGIYRYSLVIVNFGFMGNALVQGLLGDEMLFKYLIFCLPANIFVYTVGMVWLTAGKEKFTPKMLLTPTFAYVLIGMAVGFFQIPFPSFVNKAFSACSSCFSPLAMILTGFVIGKFDLKKLVTKGRVYLLTLLRVVVMPLIFLLIAKLLRLPQEAQTLILVFSAMPLGLSTIVFPAAYGGDETPGASMAVISNVIGILTVPLMMSLVI